MTFDGQQASRTSDAADLFAPNLGGGLRMLHRTGSTVDILFVFAE